MPRRPFLSNVAAAVTALAVLVTAPPLFTGAQTPAADHEQHHAATPDAGAAVADPCVAGVATPAAMPQAGMMAGTPPMGPGGGPGRTEQFDLRFIDMMTPHHASAVAMAQLALSRAEHPEIRSLAEAIIESQSAEMAQMQTWRDQWYPDAVSMPMEQMAGMMAGEMAGMMGGMMGEMMPGMMDEMMGEMMPGAMMGTPEAMPGAGGRGPMAGMAQDLDRLCATTEGFDLAFIDAMIPHHQSAVMMATMATLRAEHPELRDLAQTMVDDQQREIAQMQAWRAAWSGVATPAN